MTRDQTGTSGMITLPSFRISKRSFALYAIIAILTLLATVDTLREFVVNERALLTPRGRERFRNRKRLYQKSRFCDETDEPNPGRAIFHPFHSGWRSLASCVEYDLSLRRRPLGDEGVRRLVKLLSRREYATKDRMGKLRVLNLERQGITRRGAGYLARWLSVDPLERHDDDDNDRDGDKNDDDLSDWARMPIAASRSLFINLKGNPIGLLGVRGLERAVETAKLNGVRVVVVGGGGARRTSSSPRTERRRAAAAADGSTCSDWDRWCTLGSPWRWRRGGCRCRWGRR